MTALASHCLLVTGSSESVLGRQVVLTVLQKGSAGDAGGRGLTSSVQQQLRSPWKAYELRVISTTF